jgi:hypothetical protein
MADEEEIALIDSPSGEPEQEISSDQGAGAETETEPDVSSKTESDTRPAECANAEAEPEVGCPIRMGIDSIPRCGRKLQVAPAGVDDHPVCLMHSKDLRKQSGVLFEEFRIEFERILENAGEDEAHFEFFVFPELDFRGRIFKPTCRFSGVTLTQNADFLGATFKQNAYFSRAAFAQNADFSDATFAEDADFELATFAQKAEFYAATFTCNASFKIAVFMQKASFGGAAFTQNADFRWTTFAQVANFSETTFAQDADFNGATLAENAMFSGATFTLDAGFRQTKFHATVDMRACRFLGQAEFRQTKFEPKVENAPSAVYSLAEFAKPEEVIFDGVDLGRAIFLNCDVSEFWFTSAVQWGRRDGGRGLKVFEEEILLNPDLAQIRKDYGPVDHGAVEQIYHQLKKNYDARLDYRNANEFHFGEMEMRRLEPRPYPGLLEPWGWLRPWLGPEALYRWASDYGNSFVKPILWLLGFLVLFAALLPIAGLEMKQQPPGPPVTYTSAWYKQGGWGNNCWTETKLFGRSLITSIDTATFQRSPEYVPAYPWGRVLAILEALLTSTLFALFLLAIRRQFKR